METSLAQDLLSRERSFFDKEADQLSDEELALPSPREIARYRFASRLSRNFSKDALFARLLPLDGKKVLDYGCGSGENSCLLAACGAEVSAFDLSPVSVEQARKRAALHGVESRINFKVCAAGATDFPDGYFDVVTGFAILHHLHMLLPTVFKEIYRVLKPGGTAAFIEPVANSPTLRFLRRVTPVPCYATPDERQLAYRDFEPLRQDFTGIRWQYFDCLARLRRFGWAPVMTLVRLDHAIQRVLPFLSRYYGTAVVLATKPI